MSGIAQGHPSLAPSEQCATCSRGEIRAGLRQSLPIPPIGDSNFQVVDTPPKRLAAAIKTKEGQLKQYKWDDGSTLVVQFMHPLQSMHKQYSTYHKRIQDMVIRSARTWETCTNIKFDFVDSQSQKPAHFRVTFWTNDEVPKELPNRESYFGMWSYLGQECRDMNPSMNLNFVPLLQQCDDPQTKEDLKKYLLKYMHATILHEFGHGLGFIHEQLRGDRDSAFELDMDKIIKYNKDNWGWSKEQTEHAVNNLWGMDSLKASKFDIKSIMIYSFSADEVKQVRGKAGKVEKTFELSDIDRQWASIVYPRLKRT